MVSTFQFEIYHSKCLLIQLQQVFLVKNVLELCMIKISSFWFFIMHMPSGSCANLKPARPHLIKESSWWKLEYIYFGFKDQQLPFLVRLERINDKMQVRSSVPHKLSMTEIIFHLGPYVYLLKKSFTLLHCMWKCWAWIVGNEWKFMRTNLIVVKSSTLL